MSRTAHKLMASGAKGAYEIEQSLMFNDGDDPYLIRTPGSAGNLKTWTLSFWIKRGDLGALEILYSSDNGSTGTTDYGIIYFDSSDRLGIYYGNITIALTNRVFRDVSAWYHIYIKMDTTQGTASDRWDLKINGVSETSFNQSYNPNQNTDIAFNNNHAHYINRTSAGYRYEGYYAEFHQIDGTVKPVTDFAETDSATGQWIPKEYTGGSYGTTGFYLKFASGALGTDSSGQGNNWTVNNLANSDVMLDTPTNNFPTLNDNGNTMGTLSEGNLKIVSDNDSDACYSTIGVTSGKWYWEVGVTDWISGGGHFIGVGSAPDVIAGAAWYSAGILAVSTFNGNKYNNGIGTNTSYIGSAYADGDIVGVALDMDAGKMYVSKNGVYAGDANNDPADGEGNMVDGTYALPSGHIMPLIGRGGSYDETYIFNFGQNGTFNGTETAQGNADGGGIGNFYYAPPSGFKALCSKNLPDPAIKLPGEHFNTILYTGNNTEDRALTGVGFAPDLVWLKSRSTTYYHQWHDRVRGTSGGGLYSNRTNAETGSSHGFASFDSDGFTVMKDANNDAQNDNGETYIAWNWKANGSGSSNTDGAQTTTVSANTDAGFSIAACTGTGSSTTYGHGLGTTPEIVILKSRSGADDWYFFTTSIDGSWDYMKLNTTAAKTNDSGTIANSSIITTSFGNNTTFIAYSFAEIEGFSKFGSYSGNGSTSGPYIYTGFRPAWIMIKRVDTDNYWWGIVDDTRDPTNDHSKGILYANDASAEATDNILDNMSNGFRLNSTAAFVNNSSGTYVYMAFAEAPFKYANAR